MQPVRTVPFFNLYDAVPRVEGPNHDPFWACRSTVHGLSLLRWAQYFPAAYNEHDHLIPLSKNFDQNSTFNPCHPYRVNSSPVRPIGLPDLPYLG